MHVNHEILQHIVQFYILIYFNLLQKQSAPPHVYIWRDQQLQDLLFYAQLCLSPIANFNT